MVWYENEVQRLEKERTSLTYDPKLLFYGSSSIRLWESLYEDFAPWQPANLGFGGSTLAACDWFFDRLLTPFRPSSIIVYAGDNDLGDGRHPEEVFIFFQQAGHPHPSALWRYPAGLYLHKTQHHPLEHRR
ncbi:hypothetical protein ACQ86N_05210 [Puia sp. P3]|uniref:hypothetical protein n=1 Tax=Puia sp. P3 TaxID=3423952 RepID=UPI003D670D5E